MIIAESFTEPVNKGHWGLPPLGGYIYQNILSDKRLSSLKKEVNNIINDGTNKNTFLTNVNIIKYNGQNFKLGTNLFNDRLQNVIFDTTYHPDYWYQNYDSIYDWNINVIKEYCSSNFLLYILTMLNVEPFNDKKFIPYRLHLNYLPEGKGLGIHLDSNLMLFKDEFDQVKQYSLTYYLEDHVEGMGGELYSMNGFSYKPKANTAISINGHQVPHSVTYNVGTKPRLAFTTRWAYIDDLFLPGHPDKHLWKQDHL